MDLEDYYEHIESEVEDARKVASEAREKGGDPTSNVEPEFAEDMAERCEKLVGISGLADKIRELEAQDDIGREEEALQLAKEIAEGNIGEFDTQDDKVEGAVRTALALLTEGVVAAPIEGITHVTLETGDKGQDFIKVKYAGPIRSAGGTGQALSVLVADYVRQLMDIDEYYPRDDEIERVVAEIKIYDDAQGLQYLPSDDETRKIVGNIPVMLDAEAADTREVNAYRDLERVDGNVARGGMCLTVAEGVAQKAPKLQKYTSKMGIDGWDWLSELKLGVDDPDSEDGDDSEDEEDEEEAKKEAIKPSKKYLKGLIGGRPVFAYPSKPGGFRLRYGRSRNTGLAASGISPASMAVMKDFIAPGTQLKTERPGKAQGLVPVDDIDGPTVKLKSGEVLKLNSEEKVRELNPEIEEILDVGEMLVSYGEFLENNHRLAPGSYVSEWWEKEVSEAGLSVPDDITFEESVEMAEEEGVPLHPDYTYLWHDLELDEYEDLSELVDEAEWDGETLIIDTDATAILEKLLIPHKQNKDGIVLEKTEGEVLELCCADVEADSVIDAVNEASGIRVRERAPTRIGARMGRPEKSKRREKPKFHGLIPIGREGGDQRLVNEAARSAEDRSSQIDDHNEKSDDYKDYDEGEDLPPGSIMESISRRWCDECEKITWRVKCDECGNRTETKPYCSYCDVEADMDNCPSCDREMNGWSDRPFDISDAFKTALENLDLNASDIGKVKGVQGLESETKIVEPFEKALLRSKYDILGFSDGTVRYDLSDLPLTSFKPEEIGTSVDKLKQMGYEKDLEGEPLEEENQVCELKVQDVVMHTEAAEYLLRTANFVDDLLEDYYDMDSYYDAESKEDLVGELFVGLAPHTSAGVVCRLIGFTEAQAGYAHPFFHAAKRRNCYHPETQVHINTGDGWERTDIASFVEENMDRPEVDDTGGLYQKLEEGEVKMPSITAEGKPTEQNVKAVSRRPAPDHMIRIETGLERSLVVTADHNMLREEKDGMKSIPASELNEGDMVPAMRYDGKSSGARLTEIKRIEKVEVETKFVYCVEIERTHTLVANGLYSGNCDGDEDSFMLLLDGLLNYSEQYLNHNRSGWSMDRPIVMTTRMDPTEIDDEAHNVDIVDEYPLEFYEATKDIAGPKEVDLEIAEDRITGDYTGFKHTTGTTCIHSGPEKSAYKTVGDMDDKIDAQFDLAERVRAIDEKDVAERLINNHYLPDIRGNLRAFTQQEVRCHNCGTTYRRPPLSGECDCGNDLLLNLYEGSVDKYVENALEMAEKYDVDPYIVQSIEVLKKEIEQIFNDQTQRQTGLEDFM